MWLLEKNVNISEIVINTINTIFSNLFSSIDEKLYEVLDNIFEKYLEHLQIMDY